MQRIKDFYKELFIAGVRIVRENGLPQEIFSVETITIGNTILWVYCISAILTQDNPKIKSVRQR